MKPRPFQLVSLMEILETDAEAWWRLSSMLGQFFIRLEDSHVGMETMEAGVRTLAEIQREVERLKLDSPRKQIERIKAAVFEGRVPPAELRPMLTQLHERMCDELEDRFFLFLPTEGVPFYKQNEPLFGAQVEAKFPMMSEDISEAGTCLALNRATAVVFHLMRIMEIAVQQFGDKLEVPLASEKNWQNILDGVNKAIKSLDPKASQTVAYAGAAGHLYNVKVCWRNPTMHPKQTYTPDEARKVFDATRTFISDLAGIL